MPGPTPITDAQRATLANVPFNEGSVRHFMRSVQQKSEANTNSTLKVVQKLDNEGQRHQNATGIFSAGARNADGSRIRMGQDFVRLREQARVWLPPARDQSNGWTVNHPITRLIEFQRYLYEKRVSDGAEDEDGQSDVEFHGVRTREERDKAGRAAAVDLISDEEEDDEEWSTTSAAASRKRPAGASSSGERSEGFDVATAKRKKPTRRSMLDAFNDSAGDATAASPHEAHEQCVFEMPCDRGEYRVCHEGGVLRVFLLKQ